MKEKWRSVWNRLDSEWRPLVIKLLNFHANMKDTLKNMTAVMVISFEMGVKRAQLSLEWINDSPDEHNHSVYIYCISRNLTAKR